MRPAERKSHGLALILGALLLVLLSGAPFATVASADVTDASVRFRVESQQGPAVTFEAETPYVRAPGSQPEARIGVKKGRRRAIYGTGRAALVTPHQVRADFGRFGAVAVQFRAASKRVRRPSGCRRTISSRGVFSGTIDFDGEGGYASIHRKRVRGTTFSSVRDETCRPLGRRSAPRARSTEGVRSAELLSCGPGGTGFAAVRSSEEDATGYLAASVEGNVGLYVLRYLFGRGSLDSFEVSPGLRRAHLIPGGFFVGSADFRAGELTGDLSVNLLGAPETPLTPGRAELLKGDGASFPDCFPISNDRLVPIGDAVRKVLLRTPTGASAPRHR